MNKTVLLATMLLTAFWIAGCGGTQIQQPANTQPPTQTIMPFQTPTPAPTSTPEPPAYITVENVEQIAEFKSADIQALGGLLFSPDGQLLVTGSHCCASFYDINDLQLVREIGPGGLRNHDPSVQLSSDGKMLALGGADGKLSLWDVETGERLQLITAHPEGIAQLAFSPDGSMIVSRVFFDDNAAKVWNTQTGELIASLKHGSAPGLVAFSPDGKILATSEYIVQLWDVSTWTPSPVQIAMTDEQLAVAAEFSHDGRWLATSDYMDNSVQIWDVQTGELIHTMTGHTDFTSSLSFSKDDRVLVSASNDDTVRFWDVETGELLRTLELPDNVFYAIFSPDGKKIAIAGFFDSLQIWRLEE